MSTEPRDVPLLTIDAAKSVISGGTWNHGARRALDAIVSGDAAVYNTHKHRVVPIEAEPVAVVAMDENSSVYFRDQPMFYYWADRNGVLLYEAPPDHAALLEENARLLKVLQEIADAAPPCEQSDDYQEWGNMGDAYDHGSNCGRSELGDIARAAIARSKA